MAQNVNSNIIRAVTGDTVVWSPTLAADWLLDGYDGTDTYDDLTDQSDNYRVTHNINDGLPDEISFLQAGVPQLTADLAGRQDADGVEMTPLQYFSPFQSRSPIYGIPRDIAPVTFDQGVVTDTGVQSVRLFTGQMTDTPVSREKATLQAISRTRLLLSQLIQPPPVGNRAGTVFSWDPPDDALTSTWPVSWALHRCGVYPSPPPVSGAFLHVPYHGGAFAFSQPHWGDLFAKLAVSGSPGGGGPGAEERLWYDFTRPYDASIEASARTPHPAFSWVSGPYVAGANAWANSSEASVVSLTEYDFLHFGVEEQSSANPSDRSVGHTPFLRQSNNDGRMECYLRGDALNWSDIPSGYYPAVQFDTIYGPNSFGVINSHPGASGQPIASFAVADSRSVPGSVQPYVYGWVSASDRKLRVEYWNGSSYTRATTVNALPTDGLWHHVGIGWSITGAQKVWATIDGVANQVSSNITTPASGLLLGDTVGTTDSSLGIYLYMMTLIPISEYQAASGPPARPDLMPWLPQTTWTRGAYVRHGETEIRAVSEPNSIEAFTFLEELAQSEAATVTIDENDIFHWRPPGWYARPAAQTATETITTDRHAHVPDVRVDYSRIRNAVRVSYPETRTVNTVTTGTFPPSLAYSQVLTVPPGVSTFRLPLDVPILWAKSQQFTVFSQVTYQGLVAGTDSPYNYSAWVTLNTSPDGQGTSIYTDGNTGLCPVTAYITAIRPGDIEITFENNYGAKVYTANAQSIPVLGLFPTIWFALSLGIDTGSTEVIELDVASIVTRGARVLQLSPPRVQSARMASRLARRALGRASQPVPVVDSVELFGDPRRQPGDLVLLSDPDQSGFNDDMRILEVQHQTSGAEYTQTLRLQQARKTGRWGDRVSTWGSIIWAGSEPTGTG